MKRWVPILIALTSACGPSKKEKPDHIAIEGSLVAEIDKLYGKKKNYRGEAAVLDSCDLKNSQKMMEIATALDHRQSQIKAVADELSRRPPSANVEAVQAGSTWFRRLKKKPENRRAFTYREGWEDLYASFQQIKDRPVNEDWLQLDSDVRSILVDDEFRIYWEKSMIVSPESPVEWLEGVYREANRCAQDPACPSPVFDAATLEKLNRNPRLRSYLSEGGNPARKIADFLADDLPSYRFRVNPNLLRSSEQGFRLPLLAGSLGARGATEIFSSIVEAAWTRVKLDWKRAKSDLPGLYVIDIGETFGTRSYVDSYNRRVEISPGSFEGTLAHEIGHVLGLRDEYYTTWLPEHCAYLTWFDQTNVMSVSRVGDVLSKHWHALDQHYPLKR